MLKISMCLLRFQLSLLLCVLCLTQAFPHEQNLNLKLLRSRKFFPRLFSRNRRTSFTINSHENVRFASEPPELSTVDQHESITLQCEASGSPPPAVYWLKNGVRINQGMSGESLEEEETNAINTAADNDISSGGLVSIRNHLIIDCATRIDEAIYTCVAETPNKRRETSTVLEVIGVGNPPCLQNQQPQIYFWSPNASQMQGSDVVLPCRSTNGHVTWKNIDGTELNMDRKVVLPSGDLLIKDLQWADGGLYSCQLSDGNSATTFLYPFSNE